MKITTVTLSVLYAGKDDHIIVIPSLIKYLIQENRYRIELFYILLIIIFLIILLSTK